MSELELKLRLEGIDANEVALYNLQRWLKDAGIFVEIETLPPAEGDMGAEKPIAILLFFTLTAGQLGLPPKIEEALYQIHRWQLQHQTIQPVLELPGEHPQPEEEIEKKIRHEEWHIDTETRRRRISDSQPEATNK